MHGEKTENDNEENELIENQEILESQELNNILNNDKNIINIISGIGINRIEVLEFFKTQLQGDNY